MLNAAIDSFPGAWHRHAALVTMWNDPDVARAFLRAVSAFVPVCLLRKRPDCNEFSWRYYESADS